MWNRNLLEKITTLLKAKIVGKKWALIYIAQIKYNLKAIKD